jgi:NCAIR mutase (PurE)-related protein
VRGLLSHNTRPVLLTRIDAETADAIRADIGAGDYDREARLMSWRAAPAGEFTVTVVSAGTADWPVAGEARAVASAVGMNTRLIHDVGVAGLDRILQIRDQLDDAQAVIVVAGMEGALASVIGGLVGCPVIAVPTSVGYGASLDGITALLAMHASCAASITVVNIDSGFGAAMAAHRIARTRREADGR